MRQSGILAAAGLYALEHHIPRLANDHAHATRLAARLHQIVSVAINPAAVETNILFFDVHHPRLTAPAFVTALRQEGVLLNAVNAKTCRAVTHLDVSTDAIDQAPTPSPASLHEHLAVTLTDRLPAHKMHARGSQQRGMGVTHAVSFQQISRIST